MTTAATDIWDTIIRYEDGDIDIGDVAAMKGDITRADWLILLDEVSLIDEKRIRAAQYDAPAPRAVIGRGYDAATAAAEGRILARDEADASWWT